MQGQKWDGVGFAGDITLSVGADFTVVCSRHPKQSLYVESHEVNTYYHRNRIRLIARPCRLCAQEIGHIIGRCGVKNG
jgi:hypothetical protein